MLFSKISIKYQHVRQTTYTIIRAGKTSHFVQRLTLKYTLLKLLVEMMLFNGIQIQASVW